MLALIFLTRKLSEFSKSSEAIVVCDVDVLNRTVIKKDRVVNFFIQQEGLIISNLDISLTGETNVQ
jgi:hypothetical protein